MASNNNKLIQYGLPAIALILGFEFAYVPWQTWVEKQSSLIERQSKVAAKQQRAINNMPAYQDFISAYEEDIAAVTTSYTQIADESQLSIKWLKVIDEAASGFNLVVTNKIPRDKLPISDELISFSGNLKVEGDAVVLLNFISQLEDITRGHRVKAVTFLRKPNTRDKSFVVDVEFIKVFSKA